MQLWASALSRRLEGAISEKIIRVSPAILVVLVSRHSVTMPHLPNLPPDCLLTFRCDRRAHLAIRCSIECLHLCRRGWMSKPLLEFLAAQLDCRKLRKRFSLSGAKRRRHPS